MKLLSTLLLISLPVLAQGVSGTSSSAAGQTATWSFTPPPPIPLLTLAGPCVQVPPYQPVSNGTRGTQWSCTVTSSIPSPIPPQPGALVLTLAASAVWQFVQPTGVACAPNTACPITWPAGAVAVTFGLVGM